MNRGVIPEGAGLPLGFARGQRLRSGDGLASFGKPALKPFVSDEVAETKVEKALQLIARLGTVLSADIAEAVGAPGTAIASMLKPDVERGLVLACSVTSPSSARPTVEYRLAADIDPAHVLAERKARMVGTGNWTRRQRDPRVLDPASLPPRARTALASEIPHPPSVAAHAPALRPDPLLMQARCLSGVGSPERPALSEVEGSRGEGRSKPSAPVPAHAATPATTVPSEGEPRKLDDKRRIQWAGHRYTLAGVPGAVPGALVRVRPVLSRHGAIEVLVDGRSVPETVVVLADRLIPEVATSAVVASADATNEVPGTAGDPHCPAGGGRTAVPPFTAPNPSSMQPAATAGVQAASEESPVAAVGAAVTGMVQAAPLGRLADPLQFEIRGETIEFGDAPVPLWALLGDGGLTIQNGEHAWRFNRRETAELYRFLHGCAGLLIPSDVEQLDARR